MKKKKNEKNLKFRVFLFVILISATLLILNAKFYNLLFEVTTISFTSKAKVFDPREENLTIGFSNDPNILDFGVLPGNGSYSKKYIKIENPFDEKIKVEVRVKGNISSKVFLPKNNFWLNEKERSELEIYFFSNQTLSGYFEGMVDLAIKKPRYGFVYRFDKLLGGVL